MTDNNSETIKVVTLNSTTKIELSNALDEQENENLNSSIKNKNKNLVEGKFELQTPRAKNVLTNRKVLAEKTPNNIKRPISNFNTNTSPTKTKSHSSSPSLLLNNVITTPLPNPTLRDITNSAKSLNNPPDLFLQPKQKRRSIRHKSDDKESINEIDNEILINSNSNTNFNTSKLVSVFPSTSDEIDLEEIEHASSLLLNSDTFLFGPSKIIPNLDLHENLDFTPLLNNTSTLDNINNNNNTNKEIESNTVIISRDDEVEDNNKIVIEEIYVDFKVEEEN